MLPHILAVPRKLKLIQRNLSFVLGKDLTFSYEDREVPAVEGERDIIVRIVATGVCGSDVSTLPP